MRLAAPFGFYGSGNIGDEATLQGFARLLKTHGRGLRVTVASQDPIHTARIEPSFRYHQYHGWIGRFWPRVAAHTASAYVFPGGTPIAEALGDWPLSALAPMVEHGARWGKPSVFVGVGMEKLTRDDLRAIMRERVIPHAAFWSVRSERDRERLLDLGVSPERVIVAADMAWLLPRADTAFGQNFLVDALKDGRPLIGVNVNAEEAVMERAPKLLEHLGAALDSLVETHGARVVFLFNEVREEPTFDMAAARQVLAAMRHRDAAIMAPNAYLSPGQMMSVIGCCAMTISTRYHFCLFSAIQGVPFVAVKRSSKVIDLCEDLQWTDALPPENAHAATLSAIAGGLLGRLDSARSHLEARTAAMKERSLKNLAALDILLTRKGRRADWLRKVWSRMFPRS